MDNFLQTIRSLGAARIAAIGGIGLFLIGFLIYFVARFSGGDMKILYRELELADSKQIVQELEKRDVRFELKRSGTEILVPSDKVSRMRIEMAELELPSSKSGKGYELFDNVDALGSTNFIQNINQLRAMEGELSRTIRSVEGVKNARVHLVLPKREMFTREQQTPKASVVLMLRRGISLSSKQVSSIQHLVASAVARLELKNVSIIDNFGNLLTQEFADDEQMIISTNEERRRRHEKRLTEAVQSLLEKTIGYGKVRAEVNVEMDFSRVVTNEESYDPDQQVVRSTVTVEENSNSNENEPDAVTVSENIPNEAQGNNSGATASTQSSRTEETVNYEISKKITNAVRNSGIIKRISVAVLVDGVYDFSSGDKVYKPRSEKEMELLAALVRSAIGYDANRGDQVEVVNMRFKSMEEAFQDEPPILWGFTKSEVMKMAEGLGVALVAILVILLVIRPLITKAFETSPMPGEHESPLFGDPSMSGTPLLGSSGVPGIDGEGGIESELDELIDIARVEGRVKASSVRKIGEIIDKHPEEALSIIRTWMYQEE